MKRSRKRPFIILGSIAVVFLAARIILFAVGESSVLGIVLGAIPIILILAMLIISYRGENQST